MRKLQDCKKSATSVTWLFNINNNYSVNVGRNKLVADNIKHFVLHNLLSLSHPIYMFWLLEAWFSTKTEALIHVLNPAFSFHHVN